MTYEQFATVQRSEAGGALTSLIHSCARRFLAGAHLVGVEGPVIKQVRVSLYEGVLDLGPLHPFWEIVCRRYRNERFDPQPGLFKDHGVDTLERWGQFVYWELFPYLLRENEFVRNVLRSVGLLPCRDKQPVVSAMCQYISDTTLPNERSPWEITDFE